MLTGGNVNDRTQFTTVMSSAESTTWRGRVATRRRRLLADNGYSQPRYPQLPAPTTHPSDHPSAPAGPAVAADLRSHRLSAPQCCRTLPQPAQAVRAIAARFEKTTLSYRGVIDLATLLIWL